MAATPTNQKYETIKKLGEGAFGAVTLSKNTETGAMVAIKKVLQDPRYKNREVDIMRAVKNECIVGLVDEFYTKENGNVYLNLCMECVEGNMYDTIRKNKLSMSTIALYMKQILTAFAYLAEEDIAHRDLKPENILCDPTTGVVKVCDFGSAKQLAGQASISYICSRYYRAPELLFDRTQYTTSIDTWSIGCIMAEMITGKVLFAGNSNRDMLIKMFEVLGTPTVQEIPESKRYRLPKRSGKGLKKVLGCNNADAIDLLSKLLNYNSEERITPAEALEHKFFA